MKYFDKLSNAQHGQMPKCLALSIRKKDTPLKNIFGHRERFNSGIVVHLERIVSHQINPAKGNCSSPDDLLCDNHPDAPFLSDPSLPNGNA
jgi:hypothetical protein